MGERAGWTPQTKNRLICHFHPHPLRPMEKGYRHPPNGSTLNPVARRTDGRRRVRLWSARGRKVRAPHGSECLLTAGRGDPTESATESRPPARKRR